MGIKHGRPDKRARPWKMLLKRARFGERGKNSAGTAHLAKMGIPLHPRKNPLGWFCQDYYCRDLKWLIFSSNSVYFHLSAERAIRVRFDHSPYGGEGDTHFLWEFIWYWARVRRSWILRFMRLKFLSLTTPRKPLATEPQCSQNIHRHLFFREACVCTKNSLRAIHAITVWIIRISSIIVNIRPIFRNKDFGVGAPAKQGVIG